MPRLTRLVLLIGLTALIQGCQLAAPGGKGPGASTQDVTPNAVAGDPISVTALDDPVPAPAAPAPAGAGAAPVQGSAAQPVAELPAPAPLPGAASDAGADPAAATDAETPAEPEAEAAPAPPRSDAELACERKRGSWVAAVGAAYICVFRTRDSGKRCTRESQCDGVCLARSGTCSPLKPLLGCNEILQDNGARVTLCIE